jgi:uncharacterized protein YwgA
MTRYQLAKLILMAGGLESRKRVQKTVHLLQAAGCPLRVDFRLHYYGPYSGQLAELLDRMTDNGILAETTQATEVGTQYNYQFSRAMRESLEAYEQTPDGHAAKEEMERYDKLLETLCRTRPRALELASTMVAFHEMGSAWDDALDETAEFKSEQINSPTMIKANELARAVVGYEDNED